MLRARTSLERAGSGEGTLRPRGRCCVRSAGSRAGARAEGNALRRRSDELTAAESLVAALVANGGTNREVAASLFTTVATVEAHLTRIYAKHGIRSRTDLANRRGELVEASRSGRTDVGPSPHRLSGSAPPVYKPDVRVGDCQRKVLL